MNTAITPDTLETAAHAVARLFPPEEHSQMCPYWRRRLEKPAVDVCDCWILRRARSYAIAAIEAATKSTTTADTPAGEVIASWPQWWCPECGNRYGINPADRLTDHRCSCGNRLTPVTLQLLTRPTPATARPTEQETGEAATP